MPPALAKRAHRERYDVTLEARGVVGQAIEPALVPVAAHGPEQPIRVIGGVFRAGLYADDDCHYFFAEVGWTFFRGSGVGAMY